MTALLLAGSLAAVAIGSYLIGVGVGASATTDAYLRVLASEPDPTGGASATWSTEAVARLVVALEATEVDCERCHQAAAQHAAHHPGANVVLVCDDCRWSELAAGAALEEL